MFSVAVFRVGGGERAKQLEWFAAGIDHHVARTGGNQEGIPGTDFSDLSVNPSLAGPFLDIDHFFHFPMAVGAPWAGLFYRHDLNESKRNPFGLELLVRDKLAEETARRLSPGDLTLVYFSNAQSNSENRLSGLNRSRI
jgi:hypothetical protein